jgi:hypothetical protein
MMRGKQLRFVSSWFGWIAKFVCDKFEICVFVFLTRLCENCENASFRERDSKERASSSFSFASERRTTSIIIIRRNQKEENEVLLTMHRPECVCGHWRWWWIRTQGIIDEDLYYYHYKWNTSCQDNNDRHNIPSMEWGQFSLYFRT